MRKNITITGGLVYIGTELCKIYSGESWYNKIKVIDNRFISKRVSQLKINQVLKAKTIPC